MSLFSYKPSALSYKPKKWVIWLAFIVVVVLFVGIFKGCQQHKALAMKDARIDTLERINKYNDSIGKENKRQYDGVREYQSGIIALRDNQILSFYDSLGKLNNQIVSLQKRYKPITASVDTSVTTVPNEYIEDCAECFTLLDKSKETSLKLKADYNNLSSAYKDKIKTQESRITQLGAENTQLKNNLTSAIDIAKENQKKYEPRRKVLVSISALAVDGYVPNGVGVGAFYQDKRNRLFGAHVFGSNVGAIYMGQFALPLSLRRNK